MSPAKLIFPLLLLLMAPLVAIRLTTVMVETPPQITKVEFRGCDWLGEDKLVLVFYVHFTNPAPDRYLLTHVHFEQYCMLRGIPLPQAEVGGDVDYHVTIPAPGPVGSRFTFKSAVTLGGYDRHAMPPLKGKERTFDRETVELELTVPNRPPKPPQPTELPPQLPAPAPPEEPLFKPLFNRLVQVVLVATVTAGIILIVRGRKI